MSFLDKLFRKQRKTPAAGVDLVPPVAGDAEAAELTKEPELEQEAAPTEHSIAPTSFIRPFDLSQHTLIPAEPFLKPGPIDPFKDLSGHSLISSDLFGDSARRDRQSQCLHRYERVKSLASEYDLCTNCGHIVRHWSARI